MNGTDPSLDVGSGGWTGDDQDGLISVKRGLAAGEEPVLLL